MKVLSVVGFPVANVVLLIASLLVSLLAAEVAVRLFFGAEVDAARLAEANAETSFGAFTRPSALPDLVYELRPGTQLAWNDLPMVTISEHGPYRVSEDRVSEDGASEDVPENTVRIAVIGDSTSFGWRVPFAASYPEVLRRTLERQLQRPIELRNFSVPGYNSEQERIVFETHVVPWRPSLVILHYDHNDWEPSIHEKPPTYLAPSFGDNVLGSALVKLLSRRLHIAREVDRQEKMRALEHRLHADYAYAGPLYNRHLEQLRLIAEAASKKGIPVACLVFDAFLERAEEPLESEHYQFLHRSLFPALSDAGFHVLELYHPYQKLMAEQGWRDLSHLWIAPDDAHPNPAGHGLIAQALRQFILGNSALRQRLVASPKQ